MTVWMSKYAMTEGIKQCEVTSNNGDQVWLGEQYASWMSWQLGKDVHLTREEAVRAAEAMRTKKLASLRKQIVQLEKMEF